ncbi:MAG: hypothetical protein O2807_08605 [bacterium]|nr:hypothetical protein [bacterium]
MMNRKFTAAAGAWGLAVALALGSAWGASKAPASPRVIVLTQTGCQFLEPEKIDRGYQTKSSADCNAINAQSGDRRITNSKVLELKPGKYIFRVANKNVPYELGFYLRGAGIGRFTLPKVSGGGLTLGKSQDYAITLREGDYLYSCPLNPTPDYKLIVRR